MTPGRPDARRKTHNADAKDPSTTPGTASATIVWRPGEADYVTKSLTRGKLELGQELLVGSKLNLYQNDMI